MNDNLKQALKLFRGGRKTVAERAGLAEVNVDRVLTGDFKNVRVIEEAKKFVQEKIEEAQDFLAHAAT